jgi:hypothetical protein
MRRFEKVMDMVVIMLFMIMLWTQVNLRRAR